MIAGAGDMTQWFRAFAAFADGQGSGMRGSTKSSVTSI